MTPIKTLVVAAASAALVPLGAAAMPAAMPGTMTRTTGLPIDRVAYRNNVGFVCTGIGNADERSGRWSAYPVKLEAVGGYGQWLAGEHVTLTREDGTQVAQVRCDAPWVLMKLDSGRYRATVDVAGAPRKTVSFTVPASGQRDIVVRFRSKMRGEESSGV
ncbi:MAG TPA: hypothetical protein VMH86_05605 [Rhizomicrobium sp.]|nr:hypothetical protein [Rhizomicrobium sp.]